MEQVARQLIASVLSVLVVELVVVPVVLVHMYVAGSGLQRPSPVQVAVIVSLGNQPSSQVKVMDDPSNVVVELCITTPSPATGGPHPPIDVKRHY